MSFKQNDTIHTGNYEEFFMLYVDDELTPAQKAEVDAFVLQHSHLAEELELLMGTKLSPEPVSFFNKEELLSSAMKLNAVDEALLLYIDDELPQAEKKALDQKIAADKDYAFQHGLLLQTKLDAAEIVLHPNKKELYRREERAVRFGVWMRIAAAVILLLLGSLFLLVTKNEKAALPDVALNGSSHGRPKTEGRAANASPRNSVTPLHVNEAAAQESNNDVALQTGPEASTQTLLKKELKAATPQQKPAVASINEEGGIALQRREAFRLEVSRLTTEPSLNDVALNKTITRESVTTESPSSYNSSDDPEEPAVTDGDFKNTKKTPAKGFFRKVSRFIERKAGIGTVNDDNELLIGAVALKLK